MREKSISVVLDFEGRGTNNIDATITNIYTTCYVPSLIPGDHSSRLNSLDRRSESEIGRSLRSLLKLPPMLESCVNWPILLYYLPWTKRANYFLAIFLRHLPSVTALSLFFMMPRCRPSLLRGRGERQRVRGEKTGRRAQQGQTL